MLNESEARFWGGLLTAIGTAVMACGLVRVLLPAADWTLYAASAFIGFGVPLLVAGWKWLGAVSMRDAVDLRLDSARAWASELANQEREMRLSAPVEPVAAVEAPRDTSDAWRGAVEAFLLAGDVRGFSARKLAGVVGSDAWPLLTSFLAEQEILAITPGRGYGWVEGMTCGAAMTRVRAGLPYPDCAAPVVILPVNTAATRSATPRAATVVESTSRVTE